jgi:predicted alpha-1,2-mannosidase
VAGFSASQWVDPFIGTAPGDEDFGTGGGGGNVLPTAMVPFGMTQFGPRTEDPTTHGGYDHRSTTIAGFPLTALSGAGCPYFNDLPFMPYAGEPAASPELDLPAYRSSFSHESEAAEAGYYRVTLDAPRTTVEITAARRANLARFAFPDVPTSLLVRSSAEPDGAADAAFSIVDDRTIQGTVSGGGFCRRESRYTVHFAAVFDRPFTAHGTWSGETLSPGARASEGGRSGLYVVFDGGTVHAKVAISFVSPEGALANIAAEAPDFDFDAMRAAARAAWDDLLGRVRVEGGSDSQKRIFYTALYRTLVVPNVFSDADGRYRGFDWEVHSTDGWTQYANFSGWDVYRSWFPLATIVAPEMADDLAQSLVVDGQQGGALPKWSPANDESDVMVGDPGAASVASAYAFGARGFDAAMALQLMLRSALRAGTKSNRYLIRPGLANYLERGYIPLDDPDGPWGPPSTTLEYASADCAIAAFARALGDTVSAETLEAHSQHWQNLLNPATGHIQPRASDGAFVTPFDPASPRNYVEGNAAQYTWMIPHNPAGLIAALGGDAAASARLDHYFTELNAGTEEPYAFMGNEPSFNAAWLYNWLGAPAKTQALARRTTLELFSDEPGGLVGNDDLGASSAWHVWGALGLYPTTPGIGGFAVGSPLFGKVTIALPGGGELVIDAPDAAPDAPYVRALALDGEPIERSWLTWDELAGGATLAFDLGTEATDWAAAYRPPSFTGGMACAIGYLEHDSVVVDRGGSATVTVGVQSLCDRALTVGCDPEAPDGLTVDWTCDVPPGARAEATLTLHADADAPARAHAIELRLRAGDGARLPPAVLRVEVR